jgi:soluble lytic murein transglycosylase-like protein
MQAVQTKAAIGDVPAMLELANRLELGIDVPADPARAMALFCRAALAGSRGATLHVAAWLLTDNGPDYDPALAADWLHRLQRSDRGLRPAKGKPPRCPSDSATGLVSAAAALAQMIEQVSAEFGVDPDLVKAVIEVESSYRGDAVSPAGAAGLMQLMPASARRLNVTDRFDIQQNLRGGVQYLAELLNTYRGNLPLALAAYNAGEGAVNRCSCVPDIPETLDYVNRIRSLYPPPGHPGRNGRAPRRPNQSVRQAEARADPSR